MITISVLGLDQFVVGHYSKDNSANLVNLFECGEEDLNFYAPNSMVFHNGIEQTSWNTIIIVRAAEKYRFAEDKVAKYLLKTFSQFSIHVQVQFEYISEAATYEQINDDYPRYIREDNIVKTEDEGDDDMNDSDEDDSEPNPADHAELDPNDPNQIYLGNVFADFDKKVAEQEKESHSSTDNKKK
jgi:hypothetical protein